MFHRKIKTKIPTCISKPVYFTSYLDDAHGGDTNGDGNASSPSFSDWYGIQDITTSISTNNFCYNWSNILYAQYP